MAILYNLYRNPPAGNQQEAVGLHARFVPSGKTTTAQLVSRAAKGSALGEGDLLAALYCLEQALLSELEAGHVVQFGSLGSFSLSLEGRKVIDEKEIRSASVSVRDLVLRTSVDVNGVCSCSNCNAVPKAGVRCLSMRWHVISNCNTILSKTLF